MKKLLSKLSNSLYQSQKHLVTFTCSATDYIGLFEILSDLPEMYTENAEAVHTLLSRMSDSFVFIQV